MYTTNLETVRFKKQPIDKDKALVTVTDGDVVLLSLEVPRWRSRDVFEALRRMRTLCDPYCCGMWGVDGTKHCQGHKATKEEFIDWLNRHRFITAEYRSIAGTDAPYVS